MTTKTILFVAARETKGAVRYHEVNANGEELAIGEGAVIGTLYVRKSGLPSPFPKALEVTIKWKDN